MSNLNTTVSSGRRLWTFEETLSAGEERALWWRFIEGPQHLLGNEAAGTGEAE